jgi:hypothetical protein
MVRIINNKEAAVATEEVLSERSKVLLQMFSIVLAEQPMAIQNLLEEYQIKLSPKPTDKERIEKLLSAVAACDHRFNTELAKIILDCTLENEYDNFDFKGLFKKVESEEGGSSEGGNSGGGLLAGIANAVGGVGGAIGQVVKGRQAKDQATAQTLQGIYNYRAQVASQEKSKGKNKTAMVISIMVLAILVIGAIAYYKQRQTQLQKT